MGIKIPNLGIMSFLSKPAVPYILMGALSLVTGTYWFGKTVGIQTCQGKLLKAEAELSEQRARDAQVRAKNEVRLAVEATDKLNKILGGNDDRMEQAEEIGWSCNVSDDAYELLNSYSKESRDLKD